MVTYNPRLMSRNAGRENPDPSTHLIAFGKRLRLARDAKGLSQSQAADAIGVTRGAVSDYERGEYLPKAEQLQRMLAVYGKGEKEMGVAVIGGRVALLGELAEQEEAQGEVPASVIDMLYGRMVTLMVSDAVSPGVWCARNTTSETIQFPESATQGREVRAMRVHRDDSSLKGEAEPGHIVFFRLDPVVQPGNVVLAQKGDEFIVRAYRRSTGQLHPIAGDGTLLAPSDWTPIAVMVGVIRSMDMAEMDWAVYPFGRKTA